MYRSALPKDLPALCGLWKENFGDDEAFSRKIMEEVAGLGDVYLDEENGGPASMLTAIPITLNGRPGSYFYALATAPDFRGQGRMTGLMEYARTRQKLAGKGFALLIPERKSLFAFYEKRGFEPAFSLRRVRREVRRNLWARAEFDTVTALRLAQLRERYAPAAVCLPPAGILAEVVALYSAGATTLETEEGYGVFFKKGDVMEFVELFAQSDRAAETLLEAARDQTGLEKAEITLGEGSELFLGEGACEPYAMGCFWAEKPDLYRSYMRLMLE